MKILLFGQHFAEYIFTLAAGFSKDVHLTVCISNNNYREEIPSNSLPGIAGLDKVLLPMPGPGSPVQFAKAIYTFWKLLRKLDPQVVHFQEMPKGFSFVSWLLCKKRVRVLTIHDVQSHPGSDSITSHRQEFIKTHIRNSANLIIVHGQQLFHQLETNHPELAAKTRVVPHPAFRDSTVPSDLKVIDKQLLFFGRISKYKGLKYLVEACRMLQERGHAFSLMIAGSGDDLDRNKEALNEIHNLVVINRRITADEIDAVFRTADIVVLPYIEASQSGVAAYALGLGKATVASRIGSIPEMIRDNYNGLLSNPADAGDLADCIERLLVDSQFRMQCAGNAAQLAATVFSPSVVARSTLSCYLEVMKPVSHN